MIFRAILLGVLSILATSCSRQFTHKVLSPNKEIEVIINVTPKNIAYSVKFRDSLLIKTSELGFEFLNMKPMKEDFKVLSAKKNHVHTQWEPVWGQNSNVVDSYNQIKLQLQETTGLERKMNLIFKVYDDGVGFRYEIPAQNSVDSIYITNEITTFNFIKNFSAWYIPANFESYERLYKNALISEVENANTPITFETDKGTLISIHEANLTDYAGMTLQKSKNHPFSFHCNLVPWRNGIKVKATTPMVTPWRTIQIAENPQKLLSSNLIINLNEPNKIKDISWIEPMKYIGVWWEMHLGIKTWTLGKKHGATTAEVKKYIDFASKHHISGVLAEGWNTGWEHWGQKGAFDFVTPYTDFDLKEVASYAKSKNINFIGHIETGGAAQSFLAKADTIFSNYHNLGIKAVKTGYAGGIQTNGEYHHGQFMVNHYREIVKKAAQYHIMIDAHEPIKPTGICRTYPNMMTREGVRGMEWNAWSKGNPPEHHTVLPFTRGLAGPIDYTPGIFDILYKNAKNRVKWNDLDDGTSRVNTTLAKQLALFVVLYSPMQMASDRIENYEHQPAFKFIEDVAVDWDKSILIDGKIGDYITMVRKAKNSDEWFLGSITDEQKRIFSINLSFLDDDKQYIAEIYGDGENADWKTNPGDIKIYQKKVNSKTKLQIELASGGGCAIRFYPKKTE